MKRLLLITGDIAAGKTTFSNQLAQRYSVAVFQKDTIKEILGDNIGFRDREENRKLSNAAVQLMAHLFWQIAQTGSDLILEANFHGSELEQLHELANRMQYRVLTLVLRGEAEILYGRYLHRMRAENRHPVLLPEHNAGCQGGFYQHSAADSERKNCWGSPLDRRLRSFLTSRMNSC